MTETTPSEIPTHDRRVRVFVSSTLVELAAERRAAKDAITELRLTPVMFELGARPHPPRELYRSYLDQSDVFVGIYGDRYGWIAPDMDVSGLEDEWLHAGERPKLVYIRTPAPDRDERLERMIERIWADGTTSTTPFADPAELHDRLADDLAVLLTERFEASAPSAGSLEPAPLPMPATPIVGRERELALVEDLLRRPGVRLVTLLGPGGIGKTRLALEAALQAAGGSGTAPPRLTGFVDLASISDPALVPLAITTSLGLRAEGNRPVLDVLVDRIGTKHLLLVLDNVEHVLAAAADVARLLAACPNLTVLATSRAVLHLRGEHEVPLAPLATAPLPTAPGGRVGPAVVAEAPAVQVFVDRARQVRPDFELDRGNAEAVAQIVERLEGIPLAIELAAARVRLLTPQALVRRLGSRLDLRSQDVDRPGRQQTLRRTIEWSYDLLPREGRTLLERLSVFVGGWSVEAAEAVGAADGDLDVLETLSSLVSHSLVTPDGRGRGEPRFRMLETVREYAGERLDASGQRLATMRRLADHLCGLTTRAGAELAGTQGRAWGRRVDADLDTLRATLSWAVDTDDAGLAVRLTAPLTRYWWTRGLLSQMLEIADRTAALPSSAGLAAPEAAQLLWSRGTIRIALGRTDEALPMLTELVDRARALEDDRLLAQGLFSLALALPPDPPAEAVDGVPAGAGGTPTAGDGRDRMRTMLEEAGALFRRLGDDWGVALVNTPLGDLALLAGDPVTAARLHEEGLERATRIDDDHMRAQAYDQLGLDALMAFDVATARARLTAAARIHRRLHDQEGVAYCLEGFAALALAAGDAALAARLVGAAERARAVVGVAVWPFVRPLHDQLLTTVRGSLPADTFALESAAGASLDPVEALHLAVEATAPPEELPAEQQTGQQTGQQIDLREGQERSPSVPSPARPPA
jgi:predicted ATPase